MNILYNYGNINWIIIIIIIIIITIIVVVVGGVIIRKLDPHAHRLSLFLFGLYYVLLIYFDCASYSHVTLSSLVKDKSVDRQE